MSFATQGMRAAALPRLALAVSLPAALAGCIAISPVPALELVKAAGGATASAISTGPSAATNTVYHEHATVKDVCIEYNPQTPDSDLPAALQAEFRVHGVDSRLYEQGGVPTSCEYVVTYTAHIEYGTPALSDGYRPYLHDLTATLRDAKGTVMSSSSYVLSGYFEVGKWATSRSKVAPVVTALVTGF